MLASNHFVWYYGREIDVFLSSEKDRYNPIPSISIACSPKCNMKCPHCIYDAGDATSGSLTAGQKVEILEKASRLGAKYLQICHEGEPLMDGTVPMLIENARYLNMKTFMYTNATLITPQIAQFLHKNEVCLGVKLDSLNSETFNLMLGKNKAEEVYKGIQNLIEAGYNKPFKRNGKFYTRLSLVCTLTSINTSNIEEIKDVARFAWHNNLFFGAARLEQGGRAVGQIWDQYKVPHKQKVIDFINWCSEQTGINYWDAQPTPYCIGVCGLQIADNGDVWLTEYGGSCDFTEPDGESFPERLITIANVKNTPLYEILRLVWQFREKIYYDSTLDRKLREYTKTKDVYPNGLQDCGSARTYTLFVPFYNYVKHTIENNIHKKPTTLFSENKVLKCISPAST